MKSFIHIAQSTGLMPFPGDAGERVLAMQYEYLKHRIPLLYLTVGFYFMIAMAFVFTEIEVKTIYDLILSYLLPAVIIPLSIIRTIIWYRRRWIPFDKEKTAKILISLTAVSGLICILCGIWAVMAWHAGSSEQRYFIPLIIAMGAFSVAYCLAIVPFSATFNILAALLPINITLLFEGETFLTVVSITVITAMFFLLELLRRHYRHMVDMIALQVKMHDLACTDALTGLLNRRALIAEFSTIMGNAAYEKDWELNSQKQKNIYLKQKNEDEDNDININISIAMIDLDGFKPINDNYGHATGDIMLRMIAERMVDTIEEFGLIARLGGDEFAIMFVDKPVQFSRDFLKNLSRHLSEPYCIDGKDYLVGISYGIAHSDNKNAEIDTLLSEADANLYAMKRQKKEVAATQEVQSFSARA